MLPLVKNWFKAEGESFGAGSFFNESFCSTLRLRANRRNNSQQCCVRLHGAKSMTGFKLCATTCNRVCKQTQHVTSNNVGSRWPTRLCPFVRSLRVSALNSGHFIFISDSWSCGLCREVDWNGLRQRGMSNLTLL